MPANGSSRKLDEAVAAGKQVQRTLPLEVDEELKRYADIVPWTAEYIKKLEDGSDARCIKMLGQAMSNSMDADVQFVFKGGQPHLSGHRGMLCAGSDEFAHIFRRGTKEAQEGKVHVPSGIDVSSFRGFLEWLYLGESCVAC
jgi:hypothetical protein